MNWTKHRRLSAWFFLLTLLGFVLYVWSLHGPFLMDDDHVIVHNALAKHLSLKAIYDHDPFRFLTNLTFSINYLLFGLKPAAYRFVNVLIHVGNAFCVFILCRILLEFQDKRKDRRLKNFIPPAVSLLFLAHPLQTQAVNYIVQRSTLLCSLFYFLAIISYIRFRLQPSARQLGYFVLFTIAAFHAKQIAITLFGTMILTEFYFLKANKKMFYYFAAVFIPLFVYQVSNNFHILDSIVYRESSPPIVEPIQYLSTQFRVVATYLKLFVFPVGQNFDYDFRISSSFTEPAVLGALAIVVILVSSALILYKRMKYYSFGILFFFLVLTPESSIIPLPDVIFEHRVYLALFGLILAFTSVILTIAKTDKVRIVSLACALVVFSGFTIHRNWIWGDAIRFMNDVSEKSPAKSRVRNNLGTFYLRSGRYALAIHEFESALAANPRYAEAVQNLAETYFELNQYEKAKEFAEQALRLQPQFADPHVTLGHLYFSEKNYEESEREYREAIRMNSNISAAYNGLVNICELQGDLSSAFQMAEKALYLDSANAITQYLMGNLYLRVANLRSAVQHYERAVQLNPKLYQAYNNLANAYYRLGNHVRAKQYFEKVIELQPDYEQAYFNLANTYHELGDIEKGEEFLKRAHELAEKNQNGRLMHKIGTFYDSQSKGAEDVG